MVISQDIKDKFRIIFLPSVLCLFLLTIIYPSLIWLLVVKLGWVKIRTGAIEFGIPILLTHIVYLVILKNRFHLFRLRTKNRNDTGHFVVGMGSIIFLSIPVIVSTTYILKSSYNLIQLPTPFEAKYDDNERYYYFSKLYFDKKNTLTYPEVHTSGKHNQHVELSYYVICPILAKRDKYPAESITHWLGIRYHKTISNRLSDYKKDELYRAFIQQSEKEWSEEDSTKIVYFERVQPSDELDNFEQAGVIFNDYSPKSLFFVPKYEPFESRLGNHFQWIFYSFGLSLLWFIPFSFAPKFSALRIYKYKNNKKIVDEEFNAFFKYFIPKGEHYATSWLIDITIAYFLVMLICGAGFTYSTIDKLIRLGGVGYNEVAMGQYWRLITGLFVHANIIHLAYNMIGLALVGWFLEKKIGRRNLFLAYLITGILAAISSLFFSEYRVSLGASGAVFGLYGVVIGLLLTRAMKDVKTTIWIFMVIYAGLSLFSGFLIPQTDNAAHLGGLFTGVILGLIFYYFELLPHYTEKGKGIAPTE